MISFLGLGQRPDDVEMDCLEPRLFRRKASWLDVFVLVDFVVVVIIFIGMLKRDVQ